MIKKVVKYFSLILSVLCMLPLGLTAQSRWFVSEEGSGTKDGSSWENASDDLQTTVNSAQAGDTVWVAAGTYYGGFVMKDGVQVFGGFAGNETQLVERSLPGGGTQLSILDGANRFRVLTQESRFEMPTSWDGFVLQNGQASEGGGIYLWTNGILRRCIVRNNKGFPGVGEYDDLQGGVVLRVDARMHKVTVLAGDDYGAYYPLGVAGREVKNEFTEAVADMDGAFNSSALSDARAYQVLKKYRPNGVEGWYLPSAGEWALLLCDSVQNKNLSMLRLVENTLAQEGKTPLSGRYWSSTMAQHNGMDAAWYVDFNTQDFNTQNIYQYAKVRGMRTYTFGNDTGKGGAVFALGGSKIEGCLIYGNFSALGYAVCARGEVDVISTTIADNYTQSSKVNSSAIDGGKSVHVYNSLIVDNMTKKNIASNYDADLDYQYSAIGTDMELPAGNLRLASGASEFVNAAQGMYVLKANAIGALTGSGALVPSALDTDLAGVARLTPDGKTSIGAFEPSDVVLVKNPLADYQMNVYPSVLRAGEWAHVDIIAPFMADMQLVIELYDVLGTCYSVCEARYVNRVRLPEVPGMYVLRVRNGNNLHKDYKLIVH